jgi:large subunit ribosomal protein L14
MIQKQTKLKITDNTGAKKAQCIQIYKKKTATIGDFILLSIKKIKKKHTRISITKGSLFKALVIRTKFKRKNVFNHYITFNENSVILLNSQTKQPLGTRILGPVSFDLRKQKHCKILSLSSIFI